MNWYKLTKFAFPLVNPESHSYDQYTDIAHEGYNYSREFQLPYPGKLNKIVLWFVEGMPNESSSNWNFHEWKTTPDMSHRDWNKTWGNFERILAIGRYDASKDTVSLRIHKSTKEMSLNGRYIQDEIVKILDRKFNNPAVVPL